MANFTKSPNFIRQTSYHSITIVSIVTFSPNFIRQIDILHIFAKLFSHQTFVLYGIIDIKILISMLCTWNNDNVYVATVKILSTVLQISSSEL